MIIRPEHARLPGKPVNRDHPEPALHPKAEGQTESGAGIAGADRPLVGYLVCHRPDVETATGIAGQ